MHRASSETEGPSPDAPAGALADSAPTAPVVLPTKEERKPLYGRTLYIAAIYFSIHVIWGISWSFATTLVPGTLSFVSLGLLYVSFAISSPFSVLFLERFGARVSIAASAVGFSAFSGVTATGSGWAMIACSPLAGALQSLFLNSQSSYVTRCGTKATMGRVLGVFWTVALAGYIPCNLVTGLLTRNNIPLRLIFVGCAVCGIVPLALVAFLPTKFPQDSASTAAAGRRTLSQQVARLRAMMSLVLTARMVLLLPTMFLIGILGPLYASKLNPVLGPDLAGLCWTLSFSVKAALTYAAGLASDFVDGRAALAAAWLLYTGAGVAVFFFEPTSRAWLCYLSYALLGLGDTAIWTGSLAPMLSRGFDDVEGAYSIYRMSWPVSSAVGMFVAPHVSVTALNVAVLAIITIAVVCFAVQLSVPRPEQKQNVELAPVLSLPDPQEDSEPTPAEQVR